MHRGFPAIVRELPTLTIYKRTNRSDAPGIAGFGSDEPGWSGNLPSIHRELPVCTFHFTTALDHSDP